MKSVAVNIYQISKMFDSSTSSIREMLESAYANENTTESFAEYVNSQRVEIAKILGCRQYQ